ncbi:hypothetical protein ACFZBU_42435 [Embleya sp. NPDC008237]|uniref:hypothetical protein n=1 Tax=Embleya sp. NPDC008237 TaxID=3363978 RepID=UPI0036E7DE86
MGSELATWGFTLGAVFMGAVASTGGESYLEMRREKREADRAKQLVAGELLQAQMIFFATAKGTHWPPIEAADAFLPTSAWQEYRSRLADTVDKDLWEQLVMTYSLLELDRARFVMAGKLAPEKLLAPSDAVGLMQEGCKLGRLRRRLGGGGGGWPEEELRPLEDRLREAVDGLSQGDPENDTKIAELKQVATELAALKPGDDGAWLARINEQLERVKPDQQ